MARVDAAETDTWFGPDHKAFAWRLRAERTSVGALPDTAGCRRWRSELLQLVT
jgi:hypothetical protein